MVEELKYKNKVLHFSDVDLSKLETPKFVFSKKQLEISYKKLDSKFSEVFAKKRMYYSFKTNSYPFVIKALKNLGSKFVLSSVNEAKDALSYNISPKDCLVNQPLYTEQNIKDYIDLGFDFFATGHEKFLHYMQKHAKGKIKYLADIDLIAKEHTFSFWKDDLAFLPKKFPSLELCGIAFYVKTQNTDVFVWQSYVTKAIEVVKELEKKGVKIEFINIGSGFPVEYNKSGIDGYLVIDRIKNTLEKLKDYTVIVEPGRMISASCVVLVADTMMVKESDVWINTSIYNSYLDTQIAKVKLPCMNVKEKSKTKEYNVFGNSPCTLDVFFKDKPIGLVEEGDKLCFYNCGAYIFMTEFASNPKVEFDEQSIK